MLCGVRRRQTLPPPPEGSSLRRRLPSLARLRNDYLTWTRLQTHFSASKMASSKPRNASATNPMVAVPTEYPFAVFNTAFKFGFIFLMDSKTVAVAVNFFLTNGRTVAGKTQPISELTPEQSNQAHVAVHENYWYMQCWSWIQGLSDKSAVGNLL